MINNELSKTQLSIIKDFKDFFVQHFRYPTVPDLNSYGVTRAKIRHHFGTLENLKSLSKRQFPEDFKDFDENVLFSQKILSSLQEDLSQYKTFVVTTAVTGCKLNKYFYQSLKGYCKNINARLLILPASDPAHQKTKTHDLFLIDEQIRKDNDVTLVYSDVRLNANLIISSIKLSAKQINPLTGLKRLGQREGSFIFASPKQFMEPVATSNTKIPSVLMTTGACTVSDYSSDLYMSQRMAYLANNDHVDGALVIEIENDKIFHYRQLQADGHGRILDLSYRHDCGTVTKEVPVAFIAGDIHSGVTDPQVLKNWIEVCQYTGCKKWILHDLFDGMSVNHHDKKKTILLAKRAKQGKLSLEYDFVSMANNLREIIDGGAEEIIVVKSNHDDFLDRWLEDGEYTKDPYNYFEALKLATAKLQGENVLQYGVEHIGNLEKKYLDKIKWLRRDDDYKIAKVELGAHGDKGANGSKGSVMSLENAYGSCVSAHIHGPRIVRNVWVVGTSSYLKLDYNEGPSDWINTSCLLYSHGCRQLVNSINGKWHAGLIRSPQSMALKP